MDTQTISSTHTHTNQTTAFQGFTTFKIHRPVRACYLTPWISQTTCACPCRTPVSCSWLKHSLSAANYASHAHFTTL